MRAHVGDRLVLPGAPGEPHGRRGQIVALMHPDGSPPYRVRWPADDRESVVFPPPDPHLEQQTAVGAGRGGGGAH
ncbi:DUF1918 domain-containing protein [Pseudonocardia sp. H11422]|uniref:DUF1918 domain-containing protein n=1 Tax=Pseudonocardia sp. H11422 TaxID=2835866 RepID=UPI0020289B32|nr:DUF1918 domain-containing protein [Pseudonocardia sp. H11422]